MPEVNATNPRPEGRDGEGLERREEMEQRVVYSLLIPAVRLSFLFRLPIKQVMDLLQMASFHHARQRGLKMREVSDVLGVSMRKAAMLSSRLKQNFLRPEQERELPRRIEFMLWAAPLSAARLKQVLTDVSSNEVDDALAQLLDEGRVRPVAEDDDRFEVVRSQFRLVSRDWLARIDGLNNLMSSTANAVYARFFVGEPRAFARTISLRVREDDIARLHELYEDVIWRALSELDERAKDDPEAHTMDVSILWAPYEYTQRFGPTEDES